MHHLRCHLQVSDFTLLMHCSQYNISLLSAPRHNFLKNSKKKRYIAAYKSLAVVATLFPRSDLFPPFFNQGFCQIHNSCPMMTLPTLCTVSVALLSSKVSFLIWTTTSPLLSHYLGGVVTIHKRNLGRQNCLRL